MPKINYWIKHQLTKKPGFWFFQLLGWSILLILDYFQSFEEISNLKSPYFWLLSLLVGFCISILLREWYKIFYTKKRGIFLLFATIIISSIFASFVWYLTRTLLLNPIRNILWDNVPYRVDFISFYHLLKRILDYTWIFFIWSSLYFGLKFWLDLVDAKERTEKASLLAQKSQLQMLRYQLNPHFLFNALNSIQALVYDDPALADKMITELSDFLRYTIRDKDKLFIPLGEEVKIVEKYLYMEKIRFPDRLGFEIEVTENASKVEVIAFILQPFIENAVKHGLKTSPKSLKILVKAYLEANKLFLEVINNGYWIDNEENNGNGIQNVYERLQNAYPDKYQIHIKKNADSVCVVIEINLLR